MNDNFFGGFFKAAGGLIVLTILGNIVFWGGLIYFGFWCAKHFGVI